VGFPIRISADQSFFAAPHGFSQRSTSFIASQRQGIHRTPLRHLIALIINAHPLGSGPLERSSGTSALLEHVLVRNSSIGWSLIRKTSLSSDRSDGVRSSSRHKHWPTTTSHTPFGTTTGRVTMLGDCASIATCVTIDSRSDPTSSRCQISVSYHAPVRSLTALAQTRNCVRRTSVDLTSADSKSPLIRRARRRASIRYQNDRARSRLVEPDGIEPTTSCLQSRRSPN
jgi:hypothetical protein